MTEGQLQSAVIQLAERLGWVVYHVPDSRRVTARGVPDLLMINEKQSRTLFAELKTRTGKLRPEQEVWLRVLAASGIETAVWRPVDLPHEVPYRLSWAGARTLPTA